MYDGTLQVPSSETVPTVAHVSDQNTWLTVQGSGFRVQGSGFRVQGSGFRFLTRTPSLRFRV